MEPPTVQYVRAMDRMRIAFTDSGEGMPLIMLPIQFNHVQLAWRLPASGRWLASLSRRYRLLTYDARCQGLSTRGCPAADWLEGEVEDLSAVVDRHKIDRFVLYAVVGRCHTAIHYAVRHPERVHALILQGPLIAGADGLNVSATALAQRDWDFFLTTQVPPALPRVESELILDYLRSSMTPSDWLHTIRAFAASTVDHVLEQVQTPTLVTCPLSHYAAEADGQTIAARIPGARLVVLGADSGYPEGSPDAVLNLMDAFFEELSAVTPAHASSANLSRREVEVVRLVAEGMTNREIGETLVISERTVINHLSNIFSKTGAENRAAAAAYALRHGLIG